MVDELLDVRSHFQFGRNWASYARVIDEERIAQAVRDLQRLLAGADLKGTRFLDIGCGSGLHALAALRLGAAEVVAIDIDPDSVSTTRATLEQYVNSATATVKIRSVFELRPDEEGLFDVVYSWGVLHHTGDMRRAITCAAAMVKPGGRFLFALYRRTWFCPLWVREKRWYVCASPRARRVAEVAYVGVCDVARLLLGRSPWRYRREYVRSRGMDFMHDVRDWMGGYPYESMAADDVGVAMTRLGLLAVSVNTKKPGIGLLGTGCDEFHYTKPDAA